MCAKPTAHPGISIVLSPARFIRTLCTWGVQGKLKGCSRLRKLYSPRASGVLPLYTTRRADTPRDPEELTRAVPATTTAPHSNRKQRIPPGKSPVVVSGRFLAALESVRRVSRCEAWAGRVEIQALGFVAAASTFAASLLDCSPGSGLGGTIARATGCWGFPPLLTWHVTTNAWPGLGWPIRAVS
jgi:hypothetical protein